MTATPTSQDGQFVSLVRHRTKTGERSDCVRAEGDSKETRLDSFARQRCFSSGARRPHGM